MKFCVCTSVCMHMRSPGAQINECLFTFHRHQQMQFCGCCVLPKRMCPSRSPRAWHIRHKHINKAIRPATQTPQTRRYLLIRSYYVEAVLVLGCILAHLHFRLLQWVERVTSAIHVLRVFQWMCRWECLSRRCKTYNT